MPGEDFSNKELFEQLKILVKTEIRESKEELKNEIIKENQKVLDQLQQHKEAISDLETKYRSLELRLNSFDKQYRKNSIIIHGLEVKCENLTQFVLNKLNNLLDLNISASNINNVFQLKGGNIKPIKVEFVSYIIKQQVFQNCKKLKGTKIFIAHDLCPKDREDNKILYSHLKAAREKHLEAKIKGKNLIVSGEVYTLEQLKNSEDYQSESANPKRQRSNSVPASPVITRKTQESSAGEYSGTVHTNLGTPRNTSEKRTNTSPADHTTEFEHSKLPRTTDMESTASGRIITRQLKKKSRTED